MIVHIAFRNRPGRLSLRTRILAIALIPSLSLMLVGLVSAAYTGYSGYQATSESGKYAVLSGNATTGERAATRDFLQALRDERLLTGELLGDPTISSPAALQAQWAKSDAAAAAMTKASAQPIVSSAQLKKLLALRPLVAARSIPLVDAINSYSALIVDADSRASSSLSRAVADPRVVREDEINTQLRDLTETLDVSDALSFAAFSDTGLTSDGFRAYVREIGDFQGLLTTLQPSLPGDEAGALNGLTTGPDGEVVTTVQRSILHGSVIRNAGITATDVTAQAAGRKVTGTGIGAGTGTGTTAVDPGVGIESARWVAILPLARPDWRAASGRLSAALVALQSRHLAYSAGIARQVGTQQITTALLGSLALLAFAVVVLIISLAVSRRLIGRLQRLRQQTIELSRDRLPDLVQRLQEGQAVDVDAELPPLDYGSDEIGQVAAAFGEAQRTAVAAAAAEAETRSGLRRVFLDIAHRSQAIVYRQLKVLDQAERTQEDPDQLELLFQLDHLSTRARRNAENLIILGGGQAGRHWRNPVSLHQLIRSAISEAEDYTRVKIASVPGVTVTVAAVADLIHLLAELVDNATRFSPPMSRVEVRANLVGRGVAIEIEDQGLGIDPELIEQFNRTLHDPPDFQVMALAVEPRLGLFVVARLAARHGIRVTLTVSAAYGGTKVVVLVPAAVLLAEQGLPGMPELAGPPRPETGLRAVQSQPAVHSQPPAHSQPAAYVQQPVHVQQPGEMPGRPAVPVTALPTSVPSPVSPLPPSPMSPSGPRRRAAPATPAPGLAPAPLGPDGGRPGELPRRELPRRELPRRELPGRERPPMLDQAERVIALLTDASLPPPPHADTRPELPRRTRQAHLSPKLSQETNVPETLPPPVQPVDAETARSRMSALQRGTMRGRAADPGQLR
jgi:HAMP domain-containing protein